MTPEKIKQLESLLIELKNELGYPVLVIPEYIADGTCLVVYDKDGSLPKHLIIQPDLQSCINEFKKKEQQNGR